ncbi:hypothetical protein AMR41_16250 [Hapalosiphon sp. MRB220]|nr:hypothetical protein AMR41_16250 [Hapalosiphon sp. MRB220]
MDKVNVSSIPSKKLTTFVGIVLSSIFWIPSVAKANSAVVGTYSIVDQEVRVLGGGPLFADNTVGGKVVVSFVNGKVFFQLQPTTWSFLGSNADAVQICYNVRVIKNESNIPLPPVFCDTTPITGTPTKIDIDGDGNFDFLIRVTLNQSPS